MLLAQKVDTSL